MVQRPLGPLLCAAETNRSAWYVVPQNNGNGNSCEKHLDPCHKNANSLSAIGKS